MNTYDVPQHGSNADAERPPLPTLVSCSMCQHEIPLSEALVAEAVDYVVHFCGLDCYQHWRMQIAAA